LSLMSNTFRLVSLLML